MEWEGKETSEPQQRKWWDVTGQGGVGESASGGHMSGKPPPKDTPMPSRAVRSGDE